MENFQNNYFVERYGSELLFMNRQDLILGSIKDNKLEWPLENAEEKSVLYIKNGNIYLHDYYDGLQVYMANDKQIYGTPKHWVYQMEKIKLDCQKSNHSYLSDIIRAGFLEGKLFVIFGLRDGSPFDEDEELEYVAVDEDKNIYYGEEIYKKFIELRPFLTNNQITQFLNGFSFRCLTWTIDNSFTVLDKGNFSKLHPYAREVSLLFMMILRHCKINVPYPILFIILRDGLLSIPENFDQMVNVESNRDKCVMDSEESDSIG